MSEVAILPRDAAVPAAERYEELRGSVRALIEGETDWLPNLANVAAALYEALPGVTWAGFYLVRGSELVLGPFQGRTACIRIALGRGVCGTAAAERRSLVVRDVHAFPGHIACDPRSRSEIVIPIQHEGRVVGVLDLDSDRPANFGDADRVELERLVTGLASIDWRSATRVPG